MPLKLCRVLKSAPLFYTDFSAKLWTSNIKLSDNEIGPYTSLIENKDNNCEDNVENEEENYVFRQFYYLHYDLC